VSTVAATTKFGLLEAAVSVDLEASRGDRRWGRRHVREWPAGQGGGGGRRRAWWRQGTAVEVKRARKTMR
jgi:hypothetical protein